MRKKMLRMGSTAENGKVENIIWLVSALAVVVALLPWFTDYTEMGRWPRRPLEFFNEIMSSTIILLFGAFVVYLIYRHHENVQDELITDPLTKVYNMRFFSEKLHWVFTASKRTQLRSTLLFIDIDGFKKYNDANGHLKGNEMLALVGITLLNSTRKYVDWPFRVGGDEFAILMEFSDRNAASVLAHRLANRVEKETASVISLTIGMAAIKETMQSERDWVTAADADMYRNKKKGVHAQELV